MAVAAPHGPGPAVAADDGSAADAESTGGAPSVWPRPQSLRANGAPVAVPDEVVLVTGPAGAPASGATADPYAPGAPHTPYAPGVTLPSPYAPAPSGPSNAPEAPEASDVSEASDGTLDPYAVEVLRAVLREAGARRISTAREGDPLPERALVVRLGTEAAHAGRWDARGAASLPGARPSALERALTSLGAAPRADIPSGGYRLAVGRADGRDTLALAGVGEDGLFHAVQTLRQLLRPDGTFAGAVVRDWPGTGVRGITEGFYGSPWTDEQRLEQLDFMGRTKQNRYVYAPGDDLYRQARWREPYPAARRAHFRDLAERARRNHVTLTWTVAPGQAMCFSSDADVKALTRKLDAMWALGFRAFQLQFQDVSYTEWHCGADARAFGSGPDAAARAQARVANAVARHLAARHPDVAALSLMPTEYYEDGSTEYRRRLASALAEGVEVAWTGVGVVPKTITGGELARTREVFGDHRLVTMDNYPVNDYAQDRVFLGPYQGREPAVATGSAALLANAMPQAEASRIPLFTAADYAWNPRDYRPQESWAAAIEDLADGDARRAGALRALAGNEASSVLGGEESAYLRPLIEAFWRARTTTDRAANKAAAERLRAAFTVMRETPGRLAGRPVAAEVRPWTEQLARYGEAGTTAVDLAAAQERGDATAAWTAYRTLGRLRAELAASGVTVGKGVLDPFLARARTAYERWAGLDNAPSAGSGEATEPGGTGPDDGAAPGDDGRTDTGTGTGTPDGTGAPRRDGEGDADGKGDGGGGDSGGARDGAPRDNGGTPDDDARRNADPRSLTLPHPRALAAVSVLTDPGATGSVEAHVPGEGWRRLGALTAGGATEIHMPEVRADALRVSGPAPEQVRHLVPWFADSPAAALELTRPTTDVEIGGTRRVTARLTSLRPSAVHGELTAKAPKGIRAEVPAGSSTLPRGAVVDTPVEITVAPGTASGTYEVPVSFGSQTRTLTVRAFPRTAGPDLARTGTASSSGDETPDFPASAANDGDPGTRWSSPVEDGAWWQVRLAAPARVGLLTLHWQDAHPSAYRVQVSADGRVWRTAATVTDSRGGREEIRFDERDTRYVRVQGVKRATRYGYSLWSAEAYAVAD
ncbi:beta-N-acetylglucosaminidase domain-containing protein [Streptomyces sp. NPDC007084]|uniref:beta-N-acetylglucosaminidase domain-containing protein n=1 Tax=Streptomyces sp. NPDC007084 TaxID=3154313 RepID=UPI003452C8F1